MRLLSCVAKLKEAVKACQASCPASFEGFRACHALDRGAQPPYQDDDGTGVEIWDRQHEWYHCMEIGVLILQ